MPRKRRFPEFPCFLYVLEDPREPGNIRYIGQTNSLATRFTTHQTALKSGRYSCRLYDWWNNLLASGLEPRMRVLTMALGNEIEALEIKAIAGYRRLGFDLLNENDGGSGNPGWRPSEAQRNALRERALNQWKRPEADEYRRRMQTERGPWSEERKAKALLTRAKTKRDKELNAKT